MPDSYRLKPYGGPRGGTKACPGVTSISPQPAPPRSPPSSRPTPPPEGRRDGQGGRAPTRGRGWCTKSQPRVYGDVVGPSRNAASLSNHVCNGEPGASAPSPPHGPECARSLRSLSPPKGMRGRRRRGRAFPVCCAGEGGRPRAPPSPAFPVIFPERGGSHPTDPQPPGAISFSSRSPPSARNPTHSPEGGKASGAKGGPPRRARMRSDARRSPNQIPSPAAGAPACNAEEGREGNKRIGKGEKGKRIGWEKGGGSRHRSHPR